jgi:hypothetical protein
MIYKASVQQNVAAIRISVINQACYPDQPSVYLDRKVAHNPLLLLHPAVAAFIGIPLIRFFLIIRIEFQKMNTITDYF